MQNTNRPDCIIFKGLQCAQLADPKWHTSELVSASGAKQPGEAERSTAPNQQFAGTQLCQCYIVICTCGLRAISVHSDIHPNLNCSTCSPSQQEISLQRLLLSKYSTPPESVQLMAPSIPCQQHRENPMRTDRRQWAASRYGHSIKPMYAFIFLMHSSATPPL